MSSRIKDSLLKDKKKILGRDVWGPKAWHLLHSFSIHSDNIKIWDKEKKHEYYLFYKTFVYLIPCKICQLHYKNMFEIHDPLIEKDINSDILSRWIWMVHNRVNTRLGKTLLTYEEGLIAQKKLNNNDIFFFMNNIILNLDTKKCCIHDFDQIYHFFYYFGILYPDTKINEKLSHLVSSDEFSNISSPRELKNWYKRTYELWQK